MLINTCLSNIRLKRKVIKTFLLTTIIKDKTTIQNHDSKADNTNDPEAAPLLESKITSSIINITFSLFFYKNGGKMLQYSTLFIVVCCLPYVHIES